MMFCAFVAGMITCGFIINSIQHSEPSPVTMPARSYDALAEALVQGCDVTDDRVAASIQNYCTKPKPKGKKND